MKLHEIIDFHETQSVDLESTMLLELILPYRKSLKTYFTDLWQCEPVVMVTSVFNAAQYGIIVPSNDFTEAVQEFAENRSDNEDTDEDVSNDIESINFDSTFL